MKIVADRTRQRWSRRITCRNCLSELEVDRDDICLGYREGTESYVECAACGARNFVAWDSLPHKVCSHVLAACR